MNCDAIQNVTERQDNEINNQISHDRSYAMIQQANANPSAENNHQASANTDPSSFKDDDDPSVDELEEGEVISSCESDGELKNETPNQETPDRNYQDNAATFFSPSLPAQGENNHDSNYNTDHHYPDVNRSQRFCAYPSLNEDKLNQLQNDQSSKPPTKKKRENRFSKKKPSKNARRNKAARQRARTAAAATATPTGAGRGSFHAKAKNKNKKAPPPPVESNHFPPGPDMVHGKKGKPSLQASSLLSRPLHPNHDSMPRPETIYRRGPMDDVENPIDDYAYTTGGYLEAMHPPVDKFGRNLPAPSNMPPRFHGFDMGPVINDNQIDLRNQLGDHNPPLPPPPPPFSTLKQPPILGQSVDDNNFNEIEIQQSRKRQAEHEVKPRFQKRHKDNKMKPIPKVVCKYFQEGRCSKGDECTFAHDGIPSIKKRQELCKSSVCLNFFIQNFPCKFFHTNSTCYSGDKCKFSHAELNDEGHQLLSQFLKSSRESDEPIDPIGPDDRSNDGVIAAPKIFNSLNDSSYQVPSIRTNESEKLSQNFPDRALPERISNIQLPYGNRMDDMEHKDNTSRPIKNESQPARSTSTVRDPRLRHLQNAGSDLTNKTRSVNMEDKMENRNEIRDRPGLTDERRLERSSNLHATTKQAIPIRDPRQQHPGSRIRSKEDLHGRPQAIKESHLLPEQKSTSRVLASQQQSESWDDLGRRKRAVEGNNQPRTGYRSAPNEDKNFGPSSLHRSEQEYASFQRQRARTGGANNQVLPDDEESYGNSRSNPVDKSTRQGKQAPTSSEVFQDMRGLGHPGPDYPSQRSHDNIAREPLRKGSGFTPMSHPVYEEQYMKPPAGRSVGELSRAPRPRIPEDPRNVRPGFQAHGTNPESSLPSEDSYNDHQHKIPDNMALKQRYRKNDPANMKNQAHTQQYLEEHKYGDNSSVEAKPRSQQFDPRKDDRQLKEPTAPARRVAAGTTRPKDPRLARLENVDSAHANPATAERFPKDPRIGALKDFGARRQPTTEASIIKDPRLQYYDSPGDTDSHNKPVNTNTLPKNKTSSKDIEQPWDTGKNTGYERVTDSKADVSKEAAESAELALKSSALSTRHKLNPGSTISDQFRILDPRASSFV
ncbi:uncharacterized protein TRIADDRAFT_51688 [Trichoplax adhaerens]|uniref:C3H1-type domain-containing protein n=1 Tax=Trichoplax adhaerens TaxID=10228 RepID=B3RKI0_TRIAD|nr:predicted protein [Trichoplax adhaerens]EDV28604.1 predicted protein [Trichoplax adhaerens]|eukprot:XP_002107806.1 predicted protein [Trichoplax adhaerens]